MLGPSAPRAFYDRHRTVLLFGVASAVACRSLPGPLYHLVERLLGQRRARLARLWLSCNPSLAKKMTRMLALLALVGVAAGFPSLPEIDIPIPDIFGESCTGTDNPKKEAPICYFGKKSVLGGAFTEGVTVSITKADYVHETGVMDFSATGAAPKACSNIPFTKTGQAITLDPKALGCLGALKLTAAYCSDQDKIQIHVAIPHFPVASIAVDLTATTCP